MKLALAGLPGSGKSTLFSALSGLPSAPPGQAPSAKRVPAAVKVPDPRLEHLRDVFKPRKYTPADLEFSDLPGIPTAEVKGKGELLGALRECEALVVCLRGFPEPSYPYDRPAPDPVADLKSLLDEFQIADLGILEKRLDRLRRDVNKPSKTQDGDKKELAILERVNKAMEEKGSLRELLLKPEEDAVVRPYGFLTRKTLLAVLSLPEGGKVEAAWIPALEALGVKPVQIQAKIEAEIAGLAPEERAGFLKDYGIEEPASARLIRAAYEPLGLLSFFTMGEDEVRAWTIHRGDTAVVAAGRIHSDIAKGFVRAETISFADFKVAGSLAEGRNKGTLKLEGKEYVMKDGDCVNFRFTPPGATAK